VSPKAQAGSEQLRVGERKIPGGQIRGIDHEDAIARMGVFFVEHEDTGGDAITIKEVRRIGHPV
jgi:hypothetical protein